MLKTALLLLVSLSMAPMMAHAQSETSENKAKLDDMKEPALKNKAPGEDVDDTLTNRQMRAQSGSKSKYSIASILSYMGSTLEHPLSEVRPNVYGSPGTTDVAQLNGQISGKYAFDQRHSVMVGAGVRYITPFEGSGLPQERDAKGNKIYDGSKFDAENPYITGQYIYKASGIQNVVTLTPTFYTNSNLIDQHFLMNMMLTQISVYELGTSGVSLGLAQMVGGFAYTAFAEGQVDSTINIDPYIEYTLTDKVNLRTVCNLWNYDHRREAGYMTWDHEEIVQSVGVGIAVTRDIFLYPNVQFVLDDIRADRTNIALNSYINLF